MLKRIIMWLEKGRLQQELEELTTEELSIQDALAGRRSSSSSAKLVKELRKAKENLELLKLQEKVMEARQRLEAKEEAIKRESNEIRAKMSK